MRSTPGHTSRSRSTLRIVRFDGHEQITIRARWSGSGLMALVASLPVWIVAGSLKLLVPALVGGRFTLLLLLGGWTAIFLVAALLQLLWWFGGHERIAIIGSDLLIRHTLCHVPVVTRSFRGRGIRRLATSGMREEGWLAEPWPPFLSSSRIGGIKFYYSETVVYLGYDLDEAEAGEVVAWLTPRLPPEARG